MAKKGGVKFISHRAKVEQKISQAAVRGLYDATLDLTRRAVQDAPVKTGDLRGSGSARINDKETARGTEEGNVIALGVPEITGASELRGVVGFGSPYAIRQHEDMTLNHPLGGKAKYLEDAFTQNIDRYMGHIEKAMREGLK